MLPRLQDCLIWLLVVCLTTAAPAPPSNARYTSIVAFGDSFSDNGSGAFKISNATWPADPAYYQGRFSNGPVWVERLASRLQTPLHDHAVGGATTSNALIQGFTGRNSSIPVPSLTEQVSTFLSTRPPPSTMHTTLFVLFGGANDIFFNPNITAVRSVGVLSGLLTQLQHHGARNILLLSYYDISQIPFDTYTTELNKAQLRSYSIDLAAQLGQLQKATGKDVHYANLLPLFEEFGYYGRPGRYGFEPLGSYGSCLTGAYMETEKRTLCRNPGKRVFWDEYHPTSRAHEAIAELALKALGGG